MKTVRYSETTQFGPEPERPTQEYDPPIHPVTGAMRLDTSRVDKYTAAQVTAVADAGGSPRAQIDAARHVSTNAIKYTPHQSKRERERRLKRMAKVPL